MICLAGITAGCTSDDVPRSGSAEVTFAVSDLTRASIVTTFSDFAVYGDMKLPGKTDCTVVFNNTKVENIAGSWRYQGETQYWFPGHEHTFVAIHPLSVLGEEANPLYSDSQLSFTYTLPTSSGNLVNNEDVKDIIAATHRRLYQESDANNVTTFSFAHLLSLINFSLELKEASTKNDGYLKIHKLEMSGFGTSATINVKPAPRQLNNQTNDSEIGIDTAPGNGQLAISFEPPLTVNNGAAATNMFDGNNAIIMLPQTFEGNDKVQISLTYTENDETEETQVSATLSSFTWDWGRSYNYNIKLELEQKEVNMVISQATIVPWNLVDDHDEVDAR